MTKNTETTTWTAWRAGNDGTGKMRWFVYRESVDRDHTEYRDGPGGRLARFGSYEAAKRVADTLNA